MTCLRGRSAEGQRLVDKTPHGHRKTTTFVAYVEHYVVPTLTPGDIVIMDNLAVHTVSGVEKAIEGAGAILKYLPA